MWNIVKFSNPKDRARNHILPLPRDSKIIRTESGNTILIVFIIIQNYRTLDWEVRSFCCFAHVLACPDVDCLLSEMSMATFCKLDLPAKTKTMCCNNIFSNNVIKQRFVSSTCLKKQKLSVITTSLVTTL